MRSWCEALRQQQLLLSGAKRDTATTTNQKPAAAPTPAPSTVVPGAGQGIAANDPVRHFLELFTSYFVWPKDEKLFAAPG